MCDRTTGWWLAVRSFPRFRCDGLQLDVKIVDVHLGRPLAMPRLKNLLCVHHLEERGPQLWLEADFSLHPKDASGAWLRQAGHQEGPRLPLGFCAFCMSLLSKLSIFTPSCLAQQAPFVST